MTRNFKVGEILVTGLSIAAVSTSLYAGDAPKVTEKKNNVLFIICDDLRTELECYNHSMVKTPNINRLAENGVVFNRSYCNIPVCGASRASILTGMRPTCNAFSFWNLRVDKEAPDAMTLNRTFKEAGYITISNGKVFHHQDEASSVYWDDTMPYPNPLDYQTEENKALLRIQKETGTRKRGLYYEKADLPEAEYMDGKMVQKSLSDLKKLSLEKKPFFFGCWICPSPFAVCCAQKVLGPVRS
ncbi:MAG: sulfatase-like hydrolase/transferase [Mangrovibacterium sp.]